jgi:hypothetical protein
MTDQGLDRPTQDRLAAEEPILIGEAAALAFALTGGDDEGAYSHESGPLGAIALSAKGSSTI